MTKRKAPADKNIPPAKPRPYRNHLSKVDFKRMIDAAREVNLPVERVHYGNDGLSLIVGKPGEPEKINDLDQWIEKHHANEIEGH